MTKRPPQQPLGDITNSCPKRKKVKTNQSGSCFENIEEDMRRYAESTYQTWIENERLTDGLLVKMHRQVWDVELSREKVVNWMIQIHFELGLADETLFIAVDYFDRFLAHGKLPFSMLQLLAVTCLFLASKYECRHVRLEDFLSIYQGCEREIILRMECRVVEDLSWGLVSSSLLTFVSYFVDKLTSNEVSDNIIELSKYISYKMIPSGIYRKYNQSTIACAIACYSIHLLNVNEKAASPTWSEDLSPEIQSLKPVISSCIEEIRLHFTIQNDTTTILKEIDIHEYSLLSDHNTPFSF